MSLITLKGSRVVAVAHDPRRTFDFFTIGATGTATGDAALAQIGYTLPPCWVHLTLPVRDSRRRDPMNYAPTLKACVDGMVDAGLWADDTPEFVTCVEPKLEKRAVRYVTVELVPR